jgi:hypothetical protein
MDWGVSLGVIVFLERHCLWQTTSGFHVASFSHGVIACCVAHLYVQNSIALLFNSKERSDFLC